MHHISSLFNNYTINVYYLFVYKFEYALFVWSFPVLCNEIKQELNPCKHVSFKGLCISKYIKILILII